MTSTRALALFYSLFLLFASTAGLVAHDHHAEASRGSECALAHHDSDHAPASPRASFERAGQPHVHDCVGCHFSSQRTQLGTGILTPIDRMALEGRLSALEVWSNSAPLPSGRSLRGPPLA